MIGIDGIRQMTNAVSDHAKQRNIQKEKTKRSTHPDYDYVTIFPLFEKRGSEGEFKKGF